ERGGRPGAGVTGSGRRRGGPGRAAPRSGSPTGAWGRSGQQNIMHGESSSPPPMVPSRHRHSGRIAMAEDVLETVKDGVAKLTLNRPDRLNAMSGPMLDTLLEALPRLAEDPAVGVVVLSGAGRGFCAGGDVKAMAEGREFGGTTLEEKAQALRSRMEVSRWLHEMPKVTIAMVRGAAAGAGLSLALACDLRVASDTARFATAFARVGYSG